jgi:folate-dependent phosphoribosylglycinamide formyltransferase PurN
MKDIKWICCFSQTGSEIAQIAERLGKWPDRIITNRKPESIGTLHPALVTREITYLKGTPSVEDYLEAFGEEPALITLHGWLRIIPAEVLQKQPNIFNGHPGALSLQGGILKGKDPQEKAYRLGLSVSGCVIHRVTEGVDEGPILKEKLVEIMNLPLDKVYEVLHTTSVEMWVDFLTDPIIKHLSDNE